MENIEISSILEKLADGQYEPRGEAFAALSELVAYSNQIYVGNTKNYREFWISDEAQSVFYEVKMQVTDRLILVVNGTPIVHCYLDEEKNKDTEFSEITQEESLLFFNWLRDAVKRSVDEVLADTYHKNIEEKIPGWCRIGVIERKDLPEGIAVEGYEVSPEDFPKEDAERFLSRKSFSIDDQVRHVSLRQLVHYYYIGYKACAKIDSHIREMLEKYPDEWDFFLEYVASCYRNMFENYDYRSGEDKNVNGEESNGLERWYNCTSRGGHVYYCTSWHEKVPVAIQLCDDEIGYFFKLDCNQSGAQGLTALFYLALIDEGIFPYLETAGSIKKWLEGEFQLGVFPAEITEISEHNLFGGRAKFGGIVRQSPNAEANRDLSRKAMYYRFSEIKIIENETK